MTMLLTDVTKILKVLLGAFGAVASKDDLTQRRIGQIGEVIGAVDDVAADEEEKDGGDETMAQRRVEEAHDIIHRVAAILAMEDEGNDGDGDAGGDAEAEVTAEQDGEDEVKDEADAGISADELLVEVPWDGSLDGETIELKEDEEE